MRVRVLTLDHIAGRKKDGGPIQYIRACIGKQVAARVVGVRAGVRWLDSERTAADPGVLAKYVTEDELCGHMTIAKEFSYIICDQVIARQRDEKGENP